MNTTRLVLVLQTAGTYTRGVCDTRGIRVVAKATSDVGLLMREGGDGRVLSGAPLS